MCDIGDVDSKVDAGQEQSTRLHLSRVLPKMEAREGRLKSPDRSVALPSAVRTPHRLFTCNRLLRRLQVVLAFLYIFYCSVEKMGLLRRFAPRNDNTWSHVVIASPDAPSGRGNLRVLHLVFNRAIFYTDEPALYA